MTGEIRTFSFGHDCDTLRKRARLARQERHGRGPGPFDHPTKKSTRGRKKMADPIARANRLRGRPNAGAPDFVAWLNERFKIRRR